MVVRLWSKRHHMYCEAVKFALNHDNQITRKQAESICLGKYLQEMLDLNLIHRVVPGVYELNLDYVRQVSYIVPDEIHEQVTQVNYTPKRIADTATKRKNLRRKQQHKQPVVVEDSEVRLADIILPELRKEKSHGSSDR